MSARLITDEDLADIERHHRERAERRVQAQQLAQATERDLLIAERDSLLRQVERLCAEVDRLRVELQAARGLAARALAKMHAAGGGQC